MTNPYGGPSGGGEYATFHQSVSRQGPLPPPERRRNQARQDGG